MRFFRTPLIAPLLYPTLTWRCETAGSRDVFLTFDDGPVPDGPTDFVLETLKSFHAPATFFCIGDNIRKHPSSFVRILKDGHAIGNHTFNHLNGWKTNTELYLDNVHKCDDQIRTHEVASRLFRPPFGRITRNQIRQLRDRKIIMWDVLTFDYDSSLNHERCLAGSISAVRAGSIVVFHDSVKAERNLRYVLPRFMDHCASQGYTFRSIAG